MERYVFRRTDWTTGCQMHARNPSILTMKLQYFRIVCLVGIVGRPTICLVIGQLSNEFE